MNFKINISLLIILSFYIDISTQQPCGTACGSCLSTTNSKINSINFVLAVNKTMSRVKPYKCGCDIFNDINFNKTLRTFVYCPGFREDPKDFVSVQKSPNILRNRLSSFNSNVIMVDYSSLININMYGESFDYYIAVQNMKNTVFAALCKWLQCVKSEFDGQIGEITMAGFSLGAHAIGGALNNCAGVRIKHCAGFDPAGPLFPTPYINANTCDQVMCLHTNGGTNSKYGTNQNTGKLDFWINLAYQPNQPCINSSILSLYNNNSQLAAHYVAAYIFPEFIHNQLRFPAYKCDNSAPTENVYVGCANISSATGVYCADVTSF